jgi:hypothetical protein
MKAKIKRIVKNRFVFVKPKEKIAEEFCNLAFEITGISKEEFEDFKRKVRSGEIKLDNDLDL